jgi:hypothetical protein
MSAKELESQILALSVEERREFVRWVDAHRDEIEQPSLPERAQENEVRQRLAEMEADPALRIPFTEEDVDKMFQKFADARAQKTSPRRR